AYGARHFAKRLGDRFPSFTREQRRERLFARVERGRDAPKEVASLVRFHRARLDEGVGARGCRSIGAREIGLNDARQRFAGPAIHDVRNGAIVVTLGGDVEGTIDRIATGVGLRGHVQKSTSPSDRVRSKGGSADPSGGDRRRGIPSSRNAERLALP